MISAGGGETFATEEPLATAAAVPPSAEHV